MSKKVREQKQKEGYAFFCQMGLTDQEAAERTGVTLRTFKAWIKEFGWEKLKAANVMGKEKQLQFIYEQINELNDAIRGREEGKRFSTSKEADALSKLTKAAKDLETDLGLSETVEVAIRMTNWLKEIDYEKAQVLRSQFDQYIKSLI